MSFTQITALPSYPIVTPDVPDFNAMGMYAPWIINDALVLNDRLRFDRYVIDSVSGLNGPDVRDNRIVNPSAHGETPYDAYWGGKTITVTGHIEAGNYPQMGRMRKDLMGALSSLVEQPFKLSWWDQHDGFFDTYTTYFWSTTAGTFTISGLGRATAAANTLAYHNLHNDYVDVNVTAAVSFNLTSSGSQTAGVFAKGASSTQYLAAEVATVTGTTTLKIISADGNISQSVNISGLVGQNTLYIQLQTVGDIATANCYSSDPYKYSNATLLATVSAVIAGAEADIYGTDKSGFCGIITGTGGAQFLDFRIEGVYPCDFVFEARPVQSPTVQDTRGSGDRFTAPFQFAVRASNPAIRSSPNIIQQATSSSSNTMTIAFGRTYPHNFAQNYQTPIILPSGALPSQSPFSLLSAVTTRAVCRNRGNWITYPIIYLYGGITNPLIVNNTTGALLQLDGTIAQGSYVVIDTGARTIEDPSGNNLFSMYDGGNVGWPTMVPGDNIYTFAGTNVIGTPYMNVKWQHSWGI